MSLGHSLQKIDLPMMPPGHIAVTWAVAEVMAHKRLDYRWLAVCALLPDAIDKPLALTAFRDSHSSQNISHALLPHLLLFMVAWLLWPRALPYILAVHGHLLADRQWRKTETFWWPLFGWRRFEQYRFMNTPRAMVNVYGDILRDHPWVRLVELLALLYLAWFAARQRLYRWQTLVSFLKTGRLPL
jgi:hypothetical protein